MGPGVSSGSRAPSCAAATLADEHPPGVDRRHPLPAVRRRQRLRDGFRPRRPALLVHPAELRCRTARARPGGRERGGVHLPALCRDGWALGGRGRGDGRVPTAALIAASSASSQRRGQAGASAGASSTDADQDMPGLAAATLHHPASRSAARLARVSSALRIALASGKDPGAGICASDAARGQSEQPASTGGHRARS